MATHPRESRYHMTQRAWNLQPKHDNSFGSTQTPQSRTSQSQPRANTKNDDFYPHAGHGRGSSVGPGGHGGGFGHGIGHGVGPSVGMGGETHYNGNVGDQCSGRSTSGCSRCLETIKNRPLWLKILVVLITLGILIAAIIPLASKSSTGSAASSEEGPMTEAEMPFESSSEFKETGRSSLPPTKAPLNNPSVETIASPQIPSTVDSPQVPENADQNPTLVENNVQNTPSETQDSPEIEIPTNQIPNNDEGQNPDTTENIPSNEIITPPLNQFSLSMNCQNRGVTYSQTLLENDCIGCQYIRSAVNTDNNIAIVTANSKVHFFAYKDNTWQETDSKIIYCPQDQCLLVPAIHNHQVFIGAVNTNALYVYTTQTNSNGGTSWEFQQKISPRGLEDDAFFGNAIALHEDVMVVGAYKDGGTKRSSGGSAYIFRRDGSGGNGEWSQEYTIGPAHDSTPWVRLGWTVAIRDNIVAVGDPLFGGSNGRVQVYKYRSDNAWSLIWDETGAVNSEFGSSVALADNLDLFITASQEGNAQGAVYRYPNGIDGYLKDLYTAFRVNSSYQLGNPAIVNGNTIAFGSNISPTSAESGITMILGLENGKWSNWKSVAVLKRTLQSFSGNQMLMVYCENTFCENDFEDSAQNIHAYTVECLD